MACTLVEKGDSVFGRWIETGLGKVCYFGPEGGCQKKSLGLQMDKMIAVPREDRKTHPKLD